MSSKVATATHFVVHVQQDNRLVISFNKSVFQETGGKLQPSSFKITRESRGGRIEVEVAITSISNSFFILEVLSKPPLQEKEKLWIHLLPKMVKDEEGYFVPPQSVQVTLLPGLKWSPVENQSIEEPVLYFSNLRSQGEAETHFNYNGLVQKFQFKIETPPQLSQPPSIAVIYLSEEDEVSFLINLLEELKNFNSLISSFVLTKQSTRDNELEVLLKPFGTELHFLPFSIGRLEKMISLCLARKKYEAKFFLSEGVSQEKQDYWLELLLKTEIITQKQLEKTRRYQGVLDQNVGEILAAQAYVDPYLIDRFPQEQRIKKYSDIDELCNVQLETVFLIPHAFAKLHSCLAIKKNGNTLSVGMDDPTDLFVVDQLRSITEMNIRPMSFRCEDLEAAINSFYRYGNLSEFIAGESEVSKDFNLEYQSIFTQRKEHFPLLDVILCFAIQERATEVHITREHSLKVSYRMGGKLVEKMKPPEPLGDPLLKHIRSLAGLPEKPTSLDKGFFSVIENGRNFQIGVTLFSGVTSQKVIFKVYPSNYFSQGERVFFPPEVNDFLNKEFRRPNGVLLFAGLSEFGAKPILLRALLNCPQKTENLVLIEHSIIFPFEGGVQLKLESEESCERRLSELCEEKVEIVAIDGFSSPGVWEKIFRLSQMGVLVMASIPVVDCAAAISYLISTGIKKETLLNNLNGILAHHSEKAICSECKEPVRSYNDHKKLKEELTENQLYIKGKGCFKCQGTGYQSCESVYEKVSISPQNREVINTNFSEQEIKALLIKTGLVSLDDEVLRLVKKGVVSIDRGREKFENKK